MKIINLGETEIHKLDIEGLNRGNNNINFNDNKITPKGFSIDGMTHTSSKIPLGYPFYKKMKIFELIQTPCNMS